MDGRIVLIVSEMSVSPRSSCKDKFYYHVESHAIFKALVASSTCHMRRCSSVSEVHLQFQFGSECDRASRTAK